jgi:hypothetical protein
MVTDQTARMVAAEILYYLKRAQRPMKKALDDAMLLDIADSPVEAWEIEAAKLPAYAVIPELESASDFQVMRISVLSSLFRLQAVIAELEAVLNGSPEKTRQMADCCRTHVGPHVHGCILPGDHRGQCQLHTEQEK